MKKITLTVLVVFSSLTCVFANSEWGDLKEPPKISDTQMLGSSVIVDPCGASSSGRLSCGIGYSACAENAEQLAIVLNELECYACDNQNSCDQVAPPEP